MHTHVSVSYRGVRNVSFWENVAYVLNGWSLKVVSATFLLLFFVCLKESICETRKNVFYFTTKALFVLEVIKF